MPPRSGPGSTATSAGSPATTTWCKRHPVRSGEAQAGSRRPADFTEAVTGDVLGASVRPTEAPALLRGGEDFIGDVTRPGMVHAAILRSPHGHARITSVDTTAAEASPGVVGVFTGRDLQDVMPLPVIWVPQDIESHWPPHPSGTVPGSMTVLATDRVRFAGDPVAVVVAETPQQAARRPQRHQRRLRGAAGRDRPGGRPRRRGAATARQRARQPRVPRRPGRQGRGGHGDRRSRGRGAADDPQPADHRQHHRGAR